MSVDTAELYKVIFSYDTDKDDELALKEGETIRITSKDSPDWWLAQRLDDSKKSGLVPSNVMYTHFIIISVSNLTCVHNSLLKRYPAKVRLYNAL